MFEKILIATDGSDLATKAVERFDVVDSIRTEVGDEESSVCLEIDLAPVACVGWHDLVIANITLPLDNRLRYELMEEAVGKRKLEFGCGDGELAVDVRRRRGFRTAGV